LGEQPVEYQAVRNIRAAAIWVALLVCAFVGGASLLSLREENARQLQTLTALAEVGAQSVDGYFTGLQSAMQLIAGEMLGPDDRLDEARALSALRRFTAAYPDLRIVTVSTLEGTTAVSTDASLVGKPLAGEAAQRYFKAGRDERIRTGNRGVVIGRVFFGPRSGEWVLPVGYGVWDRQGHLAYILGAALPLSKPQALWREAPLPQGAALGLRRDDGYLMVRYPNPPGASMEQVYSIPATGGLGEYLRKSNYPVRGHVTAKSRVTGEEALFVVRRLTNFPLTFFVANPASNIVAAWWGRVWDVYLLLLVLLLAGYRVYRWALRRQVAWETERARQIRMLEEANQELEDFAYTVAHDLKAPVRAIDGHAGIALTASGADLTDGMRYRLGQIRRSAGRMGELIDDLLEFSRYSRAQLEKRTIDMGALVQEVARDMVPVDGGIELSIGPLPACEADAGLMRVVWTALLSNAVKYSARSTPPVIEVGHADGAYFVRDNGVGFDMAHSEKLFSVFSRLHGADEFEGTGAGLAIAHRILQRHGGKISAEGVPGKGATFRFSAGPGEAGDSAQQ
jgi:signal transduction histidine kinase